MGKIVVCGAGVVGMSVAIMLAQDGHQITVIEADPGGNPSAGRGLSVGLIHAQLLRTLVRGHLDDPAALAHAWDEHTERVVTPFYGTRSPPTGPGSPR